jgi:hypothetical protein
MIMINQRITMIQSVTMSVLFEYWDLVTVHNFACKGGRVENI